MMLEEELNPMIFLTVKILRFFAYIQVDSYRCAVYFAVGIFVTITMAIQLFSDAIMSSIVITEIIHKVYIAVLWITTVIRGVVLVLNRNRIATLIQRTQSFYNEILHSGTNEIRRELLKTTKYAKNFGIINLGLGLITGLGFSMTAVLSRKTRFVYDMYIPFFDSLKYESPIYETILVVEILIITPIGCCMFIPFSNLVVACMLFAICMCKWLKDQFREISKIEVIEKRNVVQQKLIECIKCHWDIISYVNEMNSITTYVFLIEYLTFGALLCASMFLLNMAQTFMEAMFVLGYILMVSVQLTAIYWHATSLHTESLLIAEAAYDINWYDFEGREKDLIQMIIMRAQKPCALTLGNIYPLTVELLQTLLKVTYSYFTILRRMYNP